MTNFQTNILSDKRNETQSPFGLYMFFSEVNSEPMYKTYLCGYREKDKKRGLYDKRESSVYD